MIFFCINCFHASRVTIHTRVITWALKLYFLLPRNQNYSSLANYKHTRRVSKSIASTYPIPRRFILHVRRKLRVFFAEEGGWGAIRTRASSITEKYLNDIQHTGPGPLLLSPSRLLGSSAVWAIFQLSLLAIFNAVTGKARASYRWVILIHL